MVNTNRVLLLLLLLISATLIGCGQQKKVVILKTNESLNTEAREIKGFSNDWVKTLEGLSYSYSTSSEEKIIALVFKRSDKWFYREYQVKNGETLTLETNEGQLSYVSLPANRTITYNWCMLGGENAVESEAVAYNEWIRIPFHNKRVTEGDNYDRQVFDLSHGEKKLPIKFQYKHSSENRDDVFECVIKSC